MISEGRASVAVDDRGAGRAPGDGGLRARCRHEVAVGRLDARKAARGAIPRRSSSPSRSISARPDFTIDLNGIPAKPNEDQLDGAAKDWYPLQRWVDVSDGKRGVTLVPLDAPLVHLGGITTGKWSRTLEPEGPTIMSWALNNHWLVNFKASQGGQDPAPLSA